MENKAEIINSLENLKEHYSKTVEEIIPIEGILMRFVENNEKEFAKQIYEIIKESEIKMFPNYEVVNAIIALIREEIELEELKNLIYRYNTIVDEINNSNSVQVLIGFLKKYEIKDCIKNKPIKKLEKKILSGDLDEIPLTFGIRNKVKTLRLIEKELKDKTAA